MEKRITSFTEFSDRLEKAIQAMRALRERDPDPSFGSILTQLEHVALWTAGGKRPVQDDINRLSFGMLASRNLDDTDQALAQDLYALAESMFSWPMTRTRWSP